MCVGCGQSSGAKIEQREGSACRGSEYLKTKTEAQNGEESRQSNDEIT